MTTTKRIPNTPTQRWLKANRACIAGRRRVGSQSFAAYWKSARNVWDLRWAVSHLLPEVIIPFSGGTRKLRQLAVAAGMKVPVELL